MEVISLPQKSRSKISSLFKRIRLPRIPGTAVFVLIAALVILNLVVLLFYTSYSKYEQDIASTDEVISQLLNTLYLMRISPESKWKTIVQVSETTEVKMTVTDKPVWPQEIILSSMADLHSQLHHATDNFEVSIKLDNDTWLNVRYKSKSTAELMQIFMVTLAAVVAFALLFSAWNLLRFTRPLKEFKRAAEQLGVGLDSNPIIEYGPSIVKETASAMDQMQQRIHNLLKDKNNILDF